MASGAKDPSKRRVVPILQLEALMVSTDNMMSARADYDEDKNVNLVWREIWMLFQNSFELWTSSCMEKIHSSAPTSSHYCLFDISSYGDSCNRNVKFSKSLLSKLPS